jgi:hypothetical protein
MSRGGAGALVLIALVGCRELRSERDEAIAIRVGGPVARVDERFLSVALDTAAVAERFEGCGR